MDKNHPFEDLFHQINDLLQVVADKADKPLSGPLPADIDDKLSKLERQVEEFRQASKAYISQLGISDEDMQAYLEKVAYSASKSNKRIFERTDRLKLEIEQKKAFLETKGKGDKAPEARPPEESLSISEQKNLGAKSPNARKNLFKRIGGNTKWRPL